MRALAAPVSQNLPRSSTRRRKAIWASRRAASFSGVLAVSGSAARCSRRLATYAGHRKAMDLLPSILGAAFRRQAKHGAAHS